VNLEILVRWSILPPLLLLAYYYWRVPTAPSILRLLMFFSIGAVSGFVSLILGLLFENAANSILDWQGMQQSLLGIALRQLIAVGPIEEACKLAAVLIPSSFLKRHHQLRPSTVFLCAIAVALGFTAQENWNYFYHGTEDILPRLIGTPVHAVFVAPWAYALATSMFINIPRKNHKKIIFKAWLTSVIFHALVNVLSSASQFRPPLRFLSYGFFPFLLWMYWRLEQLLRQVQGKHLIIVISGWTRTQRNWRRGLVLFALMFGGNAIFGLFLLARSLSPLTLAQFIYTDIVWISLRRLLINIFYAVLAWTIYWYLRRLARVGS
jgi:RsiW-degrading membrane proteinase PrsW (M82 family)